MAALNSLGGLFQDQGKYSEALPVFERALRIEEKTLGQDHPDIATSLNNLATLNFYLGANEMAESLYIRSLEIYENAYGKEHPFVATVLVNMVEFYEKTGRRGEAGIFAERLKQIQSRYQ